MYLTYFFSKHAKFHISFLCRNVPCAIHSAFSINRPIKFEEFEYIKVKNHFILFFFF